jgi:hypothetical protein
MAVMLLSLRHPHACGLPGYIGCWAALGDIPLLAGLGFPFPFSILPCPHGKCQIASMIITYTKMNKWPYNDKKS